MRCVCGNANLHIRFLDALIGLQNAAEVLLLVRYPAEVFARLFVVAAVTEAAAVFFGVLVVVGTRVGGLVRFTLFVADSLLLPGQREV